MAEGAVFTVTPVVSLFRHELPVGELIRRGRYAKNVPRSSRAVGMYHIRFSLVQPEFDFEEYLPSD